MATTIVLATYTYTCTSYAEQSWTFLGGANEANGYQQHSVSIECECYHPRSANSDWTVSYNCQADAATKFW